MEGKVTTELNLKDRLIGSNIVNVENCKPGTRLEVRYLPYMGGQIRLQFAGFYDEQGVQEFGTSVFGDGTGNDSLPVVLKSSAADRISKAKEEKNTAIENDKASLKRSLDKDYGRQQSELTRSAAFHDGGGQAPNMVRVKNRDNEWISPCITVGEKAKFTVIKLPNGKIDGHGQGSSVAVKYVSGPIMVQAGSERKHSDITTVQLEDIESIQGKDPKRFIEDSYFIIKKEDLDYFRRQGLLK
jgi:hypothetical protein